MNMCFWGMAWITMSAQGRWPIVFVDGRSHDRLYPIDSSVLTVSGDGDWGRCFLWGSTSGRVDGKSVDIRQF